MGFVTDTIANLLNGVSQAPPTQRDSSQFAEQINGLSSLSRGLRKRPPTQHVAKLSSSSWAKVFLHPFIRSESEKYRVVVTNGDLKVFDQNGVEQTVIFPNGKAYLTGSDFRAVTVGDTTYIVNRDKVVAKTLTASPALVHEAFLVVRLATSGTTYSVTINGRSLYYTAPDNANTDQAAEALRVALQTDVSLNAAGFVFTRFGSTIHVVRQDAADFTISSTDGLSNSALSAIKGQVQLFTDLPDLCPNGTVLEVAGVPESDIDNYYVQYTDAAVEGAKGVWKEVPKPNVLVALDAETLPHTLVRGGYILGPLVAEGVPPVPPVGDGAGISATYGWQTDDAAGALGEYSDWTVVGQGKGFRTAPAGLDGTQRTITVRYSFSAVTAYSANHASAVLLTNTGPATAFVERARKDYNDGSGGFSNQTLSYTGNIPAGAEVMLRLEYSTAPAYGTVPSPPAGLTGQSKTNVAGAGLTVMKDVGTAITFDATQKYAAGCVVSVLLDGTTTFAHTVGSTDETGAQVATALHALINPSVAYDSVNPSDGLLVVKQAGGSPPGSTVVSVAFDPVTTFWNPDLDMVPGDLVGRTIRNLTDGSTASITANTKTTITASGKAGGSDVVFDEGDRCVVESDGTYFVFGPAAWSERGAGDDTTCPFPSIVGQTISDVSFFQNRLGLHAGENTVLSAAGDYLRLFRASAAQLLADDPIDIKAALGKVTKFQNAVAWTDGLYLFGDHAEYRLTGSLNLTPETVKLDLMGEHPCSKAVRPAVAGEALLIPSERNGAIRMAEARVLTTQSGDDSLVFRDITKHVPTYLAGNLVALACDPQAEIIAVATDFEGGNRLYVCVYHDEGDRRVQLSWSRWDFSYGSRLIGVDIIDGVLGLVFTRADGAYLETLSLEPSESGDASLLYLNGAALLDGSFTLDGLLV